MRPQLSDDLLRKALTSKGRISDGEGAILRQPGRYSFITPRARMPEIIPHDPKLHQEQVDVQARRK